LCRSSAGHLRLYLGNDPSFTDEGGGAELWQLDTTAIDAAKIQLELIEFQ